MVIGALDGTFRAPGRMPCQGIPDRWGYQIACFWTQKQIQLVLPEYLFALATKDSFRFGIEFQNLPILRQANDHTGCRLNQRSKASLARSPLECLARHRGER
jgi:hypothetical protein